MVGWMATESCLRMTRRAGLLSSASTPHAFIGSASDVTIEDLVVQKYAVPSQDGAVQAQDTERRSAGPGWVIEDVEIRLNHAAGLRTGDATVVRRVFAHHNGQLGIAVSGGEAVSIVDSELSYNNIRGYLWEWEGGGGKFTRTRGLVVRGTNAHDNLGPGSLDRHRRRGHAVRIEHE